MVPSSDDRCNDKPPGPSEDEAARIAHSLNNDCQITPDMQAALERTWDESSVDSEQLSAIREDDESPARYLADDDIDPQPLNHRPGNSPPSLF